MLVQCLLTARSETTRRWAIALLDRPSAISASTWRSRSVSRATGAWLERLASSFATPLGQDRRVDPAHQGTQFRQRPS
jgi:hypothetical protein